MAVEAPQRSNGNETLPGGSSAQGQPSAAYENWRKILLQSAAEINSVFCILNCNNKLLEFTTALICTFYWLLGSKGS